MGQIKQRIIESEAFGWLHKQWFLLNSRIQRWNESPADVEMRRQARERVDEVNRQVKEAVDKLVAAHPELNPERFGIPVEMYDTVAFFAAVDGVTLLLRRYDRHSPNGRMDNNFVLHEDGRMCALDGEELIPPTTILNEISHFISEYYRPRPDEMTHSFGKALRKERDRIAGVGVKHAQTFLRWMLAALRVRPELIHGFRIEPITDDPTSVTLRTIKSDMNDDPLDGWKAN
ncbi:MAG: hypothetical protein V1738_00170 [Patescibacteria group bacterium]